MKEFYYNEFKEKKEIIAEQIEVRDNEAVIIIVRQGEALKMNVMANMTCGEIAKLIWDGFGDDLCKMEAPILLATFI